MLTPLQRIDTKDAAGNPNGYVVPIWRADSGERIEQVYLTVVRPGKEKGPHLHQKRCGKFICIRGAAQFILRPPSGIYVRVNLNGNTPEMLVVPQGTVALIRCISGQAAYLLNMPDPAWSAEDPDEHEVQSWNPPC